MLCHETIAQVQTPPRPFYGSLAGQIAIPQNAMKDCSATRGGFRIEFGRPFKKMPALSWGFDLSGILSGAKTDAFKGLEVKTKTEIYGLHYFLRLMPVKKIDLKPYFDASAGFMSASTETTSTVVDSPTFLEEVLLNRETEVETTTHESQISSNFSYSVGAGVIIKRIVMIGVRYRHTNPVSYVDKNEVYVKDNTIKYNVRHIPLDMIEVTIGISNWGSH
jgi:hypothetical protein